MTFPKLPNHCMRTQSPGQRSPETTSLPNPYPKSLIPTSTSFRCYVMFIRYQLNTPNDQGVFL